MTHSVHTSTVYIIDSDAGLSLSTKALLEARQKSVVLIDDADDFFKCSNCSIFDTVLLNLSASGSAVFRLLNKLILLSDRPNIILTTDFNAALQPGDTFPGDGVTVLVHPVAPQDLLKAIELAD